MLFRSPRTHPLGQPLLLCQISASKWYLQAPVLHPCCFLYFALIPGITLHLFFILACFTSSSLLKCTLLVVVQSLSHIRLFAIPWTAAHQASLSFTISQSLLKLVSIESVMPSNHLRLCHHFPLLSSILPSMRVLF